MLKANSLRKGLSWVLATCFEIFLKNPLSKGASAGSIVLLFYCFIGLFYFYVYVYRNRHSYRPTCCFYFLRDWWVKLRLIFSPRGNIKRSDKYVSLSP